MNASPSLTASSKEDYDLKCRLLDDVLNVIDLENRYTIIFVVFVHLAANYSTNIYDKQWLPEKPPGSLDWPAIVQYAIP